MVWVVNVDIAGQRQADRFLLTAGFPGQKRDVTVGRPPAKSDAKPDIVVPEKSVSKVHAVLQVDVESSLDDRPNRLLISDKSRYGTIVNGQKMPEGKTQELRPGDIVQLAPKTFLAIEDLPLVVAVHPEHPELDDILQAARHAGALVVHEYGGSVTHVMYGPGDSVWSGLAHGAMRGAPFAGLDWLQQVASAGLLVGALPEPPGLSRLQLGPVQQPISVPLPPPACTVRQLLAGCIFGYSNDWEDSGLAALVRELGGRVLIAPGSQAAGAVTVLTERQGAGGGNALPVGQFLTHLLTTDAESVRRLVSGPARGAAAAAGTLGFAAPAAAAGQEPADSDMTEAAEEEEEVAFAGEVQQLRLGAANGDGRGARAAHAGEAGTTPQAPAAVEADGWMVVARRPEDAQQQDGQHPDGPTAHHHHEEAPPPKRRRLADASAAAPAASTRAAGVMTETTNLHQTPRPRPARVSQPPQGPVSPLPDASLIPQPFHHPDQDAPWMTQHPIGRGAPAAAGSKPAPALVAVKDEQDAAAPRVTGTATAAAAKATGQTVRSAKGKTRGKGKAAAGAEDEVLQAAARVKEEAAAPVPEVNDASAQVVLEVDLFAPTPDPALPPRCPRHGSAEPSSARAYGSTDVCSMDGPGSASGSGPGSGGSLCYEEGGGDGAPGGPSDFKRFRRKVDQQLPAASGPGGAGAATTGTVQPLPVFLVDNFFNSDEAEAFRREEEERATSKRRADEMFKNADVGSKRPPRAPKRA